MHLAYNRYRVAPKTLVFVVVISRFSIHCSSFCLLELDRPQSHGSEEGTTSSWCWIGHVMPETGHLLSLAQLAILASLELELLVQNWISRRCLYALVQ